ncbi:Ubiquitin domain-containing protein DSK2a [Abeliophyllum distichum]|uniref:Ubiquitin domain-containing protein DSK2a n=1 Tax=Abeliophyllum distichum TaxID=126358 RepID=A0ABD1V1N3_9LAMI
MLSSVLHVRQALLSQLDHQQTSREPGQNGGESGALDNLRLDLLMNMFGGLGTGGLTAPNRSNVPPEELYATQLSQLQEMGFFDTQENIRALIASAGNVHAAVEQLLGNPGQ